MAAGEGNVGVMQCLVEELGADINLGDDMGCMPLHIAAHKGYLAVVQYLVKVLSADVNRGDEQGCPPSYIAAQKGHLDVIRCLVGELGADIKQASAHGSTPLMIAAEYLHHEIVRYLLKHGADAQATHRVFGTAGDAYQHNNAPAEETAYLQARTHCANPSCTNAGLKKCERCLKVYFCGSACIRAHWPAHKAECKAAAAKFKAAGSKTSSSGSLSPSS
jgi:hypothetical protein